MRRRAPRRRRFVFFATGHREHTVHYSVQIYNRQRNVYNSERMRDSNIKRYLGLRIKQIRARHALSLRDLANQAGVSAAMISEIERGKKAPTITVLSAIATALDVPTSYLFEKEEPAANLAITRRAEHRIVEIAPGTTNVVLGHPIAGSNLHFVRLELLQAAQVPPVSPHPRGSIERAHVANGRVALTVGEESAVLDTGDSCSFPADRPHTYRNLGRGVAKVYLVVEFAKA